ncbi:hypothetical protein SAMN05444920_106302 [Nonomuraea solani]|uniref:Uncharacterized protein n=1 Tax=Nonomuraea solani TaxID=1144553 RepID=A0A1H6DVK0_9ACTN|nr:hypothetical protein [Nonomuraea solani]SEG88773.1 hypothetical protein SAMN05444920_106302 [Nonomuraea solani]
MRGPRPGRAVSVPAGYGDQERAVIYDFLSRSVSMTSLETGKVRR